MYTIPGRSYQVLTMAPRNSSVPTPPDNGDTQRTTFPTFGRSTLFHKAKTKTEEKNISPVGSRDRHRAKTNGMRALRYIQYIQCVRTPVSFREAFDLIAHFSTAVPFRGQTTWSLTGLSPKTGLRC